MGCIWTYILSLSHGFQNTELFVQGAQEENRTRGPCGDRTRALGFSNTTTELTSQPTRDVTYPLWHT